MAAPVPNECDSVLVKTCQGAAVVNGIHTDVVCMDYEDRIFIVVTQFRKLGTLVHACRDVVLNESSGNVTYTTHVLLGKDEPMIHVFARSLVSKILVDKPILLSVALKDMNKDSLKTLEELVLKHVTSER